MESSRLVLHPVSLDVMAEQFALIDASRAELEQFLPWVSECQTVYDLEKNIRLAMDNYQQFTGEFWFNVFVKASHTLIGAVGFIIRDASVPYFEIGYWLSNEWLGKGMISEAVQRVEQYAFDECHANRLEIKMAGTNQRSRAVVLRCGYQLEACLHMARMLPCGQPDSTLIYAKIRE